MFILGWTIIFDKLRVEFPDFCILLPHVMLWWKHSGKQRCVKNRHRAISSVSQRGFLKGKSIVELAFCVCGWEVPTWTKLKLTLKGYNWSTQTKHDQLYYSTWRKNHLSFLNFHPSELLQTKRVKTPTYFLDLMTSLQEVCMKNNLSSCIFTPTRTQKDSFIALSFLCYPSEDCRSLKTQTGGAKIL